MYTISIPSGTIRLDGVIIEQDDSKQPYITYALWLAAGNGPTEIADQEEPVRKQHISVTPFQLRQALIAMQLDESVESIVDQSGDKLVKAAWHYASSFETDHPLIISMLPYLGMDEDQMYAVFELARGM